MSVSDVFGVALGLTNSVAGYVKDYQVRIAFDRLGNRAITSCVAFPPNGKPLVVVGPIARQMMKINAEGVIYDYKRLLGIKYDSPIVERMKKSVSFEIVDDGNNKPQVSVKQQGKEIRKYPEEISAMILQELHKLVSHCASCDIGKVVMTVPVYFNEYQRQATMNAGKMAGLDVVALISEPVAAAYAYADQNEISVDNKVKIILIYDLGGGTFDVTIISETRMKLKVLGFDGDSFLGGNDLDNVLRNSIIGEFEEQLGYELTASQRGLLRFKCEEAKIPLRSLPETEITLGDVDVTLTRSRMDRLLKPLIQQSIDICDRLLKSCNLRTDDIDDIILVGGSTKLNLVHSMLEEHYHKELNDSINPDECVAYGAAKYGFFLSGGGENWLENTMISSESLPLMVKSKEIVCVTDLKPMSNITVNDSIHSLSFIGDYEIKSIEVKNGDELNGELIIVRGLRPCLHIGGRGAALQPPHLPRAKLNVC